MVVFGIVAHKRTHAIVAVDARGRQLASRTIGTDTKDHLDLLTWAGQVAGESESLLWAVEDCRHLSRRLERDLLAAGQTIVRVPPKLMAHVRTRRGPTASPIRSTRSLSPGPRSANRTSPSPGSTAQTATSDC
jgi:transposase